MDVKIPTDPTIPNPQGPKDAPHSHNGGNSGFMPCVPAWERLADAIRRVAGRRPKELAQADLCRAIADGTIYIRCRLKKHITRLSTSKTALEGKDFHIPTEIKPEDLNWETSCPVKPWLVRDGGYSTSGYWHLDWIEVRSADVTKVLCAATEQDENTRHGSSEPLATATSRPGAESQDMPVGVGARSTAGRQKPGAPGHRRGRRPQKFEQTKEAMEKDIQRGRLTMAELKNMLEKNLAARYGFSRDTARRARVAVLSELNSRQIPTNDK